MRHAFLLILCSLLLLSCNNDEEQSENINVQPPAQIAYSLVKTIPHDTTSFTQGLFFHNGEMFESTGEKDKSWILKVNTENGTNNRIITLPASYFGEGSSILNNKMYQLTWKDQKVFVYDAVNYKPIGEFVWPYEGWGMTTDSMHLIISTGSSELFFVEPESFNVVKKITVTDNFGPMAMLNELEYVDGFIYANVFETNNIAKIDPATGKVVGTLNLTSLLANDPKPLNATEINPNNVLNGIAYNPDTQTFFVTGKRWSKMFEIKLQ